jgi:hypothetical protein
MEKIITKRWIYIVGALLAFVYFWGAKNMYFHQDDLDWFILANQPLSGVLQAPIGDHVNYLWRILLSLEWNLFGLQFAPYLLVSLLLHGGVIWLLYKITYETTKRKDLSVMAAIIFAINTNWTEIILWISGQTISITVFFVLLAMYSHLRKRGQGITLLLSGMTSALALGLPLAHFLTYGFDFAKKRFTRSVVYSVATLALVGLVYFFKGTDGTKIAYSLDWVIQVAEVATLMLVNTVVGRLFIPFDRYEIVRIILVLVGGTVLIWKQRSNLRTLRSDKWSRFLILQLIFYNLIVAAGRAQFGVGIMRAERYGYLGLSLVLLIVARVLRKTTLSQWVWWIVLVLVGLQTVGFYRRANDYIVRPQQLKQLIEQVRSGEDKSEGDVYLPHFVLNDERLKYSDLYMLRIR